MYSMYILRNGFDLMVFISECFVTKLIKFLKNSPKWQFFHKKSSDFFTSFDITYIAVISVRFK